MESLLSYIVDSAEGLWDLWCVTVKDIWLQPIKLVF